MWLFLLVLCFWAGAIFGGRSLYKTWRHGRVLQPARYLKEIVSVDYYHRLSRAQFESLVMQMIKARNFTLLGDPCLGRAAHCWFAPSFQTAAPHGSRRSHPLRSHRTSMRPARSGLPWKQTLAIPPGIHPPDTGRPSQDFRGTSGRSPHPPRQFPLHQN